MARGYSLIFSQFSLIYLLPSGHRGSKLISSKIPLLNQNIFYIKKYFLKYVFLYANGSITNIHNWWGRSILTNDFPFKTNAHSLLVTKCNFVPHLMPLGLKTPCLWITAAIFYEKFIMVNTKLKQAIPDDYEEEHAGPFLNQSMS